MIIVVGSDDNVLCLCECCARQLIKKVVWWNMKFCLFWSIESWFRFGANYGSTAETKCFNCLVLALGLKRASGRAASS